MSLRVAVEGGECAVVDSRPPQQAGVPLLLLHGFLGSRHSWEGARARLEARHRVVCPDLPGHGETDVGEDVRRYGADAIVTLLDTVLDELAIERVVLAGYSMGGRAALYYALERPHRVSGLLLESASPGIAEAEARAFRCSQDERRAHELMDDGLEAFVDRWQALDLFASQATLPESDRRRVRAERVSGVPRGLALSLLGFDAGTQPCVSHRLGELRCPTVLMAGALDGKFAALASTMAEAVEGAVVRIIDGAGHNVHLERPREFVRELSALADGRYGTVLA